MFRSPTSASKGPTFLGTMELLFHATVRNVRKGHRNAIVVLLQNILQNALLLFAFFLFFQLLGTRAAALRGDFLLYLLSGIFLYITHVKAMGAVLMSDAHASPMMLHAPMNGIIAIVSGALSALYIQILTLLTILTLYHVFTGKVLIDQPAGAMGMMLAAWFSGAAVGVVFRALKPWMPEIVDILSSIYSRANMIASGKMFVANSLPSTMLVFFDWNPLFHAIDQARGFIFLHYNPNFTWAYYPLIVGLILLLVGMMGDFFTHKNASSSWGAAR